jgi:hypothetical protein
LLKGAEKELYGSADRYNEARPGLGDDFLREARAAIDELVEYPTRWPISGAARTRHLSRFPFSIRYRFDSEVLTVVAVAHQKRRPFYWTRRR